MDRQKLLLFGGLGVGLFWLLNQKGGGMGNAGQNYNGPPDQAGSPRTGSCSIYGATYTPGQAIPAGCAVGHDVTGRAMFVDLH